MHYKSKSYTTFTIFNNFLLTCVGLICIAPLIHILAVSFSSSASATANLVKLWPIGFNLDAWEVTMGERNFLISLWNGTFRTILGTSMIMTATTLAAYTLSKEDEDMKGRKFYIYFFIIIMLFNAGIIPQYILILNLGLMNTVWALVFTNSVNVFNMILLLNFFRTGVPKSLEESSFMDGANHFRTLFSIYLPISMPAIATVSLFTIVYQWNSWFDGLMFLTDTSKYPLSTFLQTIIVRQDFSNMSMDPGEMELMSNRTVKASQIFIGALPILMVYPFLQKYFVKGIILGSVKE